MREVHACAAKRPRLWGAAQAIQEFSKVGKPIYITETGIADARDALRAEWAEAYFRAVRWLLAGSVQATYESAGGGSVWSPQSCSVCMQRRYQICRFVRLVEAKIRSNCRGFGLMRAVHNCVQPCTVVMQQSTAASAAPGSTPQFGSALVKAQRDEPPPARP